MPPDSQFQSKLHFALIHLEISKFVCAIHNIRLLLFVLFSIPTQYLLDIPYAPRRNELRAPTLFYFLLLNRYVTANNPVIAKIDSNPLILPPSPNLFRAISRL